MKKILYLFFGLFLIMPLNTNALAKGKIILECDNSVKKNKNVVLIIIIIGLISLLLSLHFLLNKKGNNTNINESNNVNEKMNYEIKTLDDIKLLYVNGKQVEEIKADIERIGKLDFIFAKAKYSRAIKGITPLIKDNKISKETYSPTLSSLTIIPHNSAPIAFSEVKPPFIAHTMPQYIAWIILYFTVNIFVVFFKIKSSYFLILPADCTLIKTRKVWLHPQISLKLFAPKSSNFTQ